MTQRNVNDRELSAQDLYPNQVKKPLRCILGRHDWRKLSIEFKKANEKSGYTFIAGRVCRRRGCNAQETAEYNMLDFDYKPVGHVDTLEELKMYVRAEFAKLQEDARYIAKLQGVIETIRKDLGLPKETKK